MEYIKAISSLLKDAEWSMTDLDLNTLQIHTVGVTLPTEKQIQDEMNRLKQIEESKPSAKAALLDRLGITSEEATLLLS